MDLDGTNSMQLTSTDRADKWPVWSPDGQYIAFASTRGSAESYGTYIFNDIYVMEAGGSSVRQVTRFPNSDEGAPSWSPDGQRLAFTSDRDGNLEIYVINLSKLPEVFSHFGRKDIGQPEMAGQDAGFA